MVYLRKGSFAGVNTDDFRNSSSMYVALINIGVLKHASVSDFRGNFAAFVVVVGARNSSRFSIGLSKEILRLNALNKSTVAWNFGSGTLCLAFFLVIGLFWKMSLMQVRNMMYNKVLPSIAWDDRARSLKLEHLRKGNKRRSCRVIKLY